MLVTPKALSVGAFVAAIDYEEEQRSFNKRDEKKKLNQRLGSDTMKVSIFLNDLPRTMEGVFKPFTV